MELFPISGPAIVVRGDEWRKEISPNDVDLSMGLSGAFGDDREMRTRAMHLLEFLQERGTWDPFSLEELQRFYREHGLRDPALALLGLSGSWYDDLTRRIKTPPAYLVLMRDEKLHLTNFFLEEIKEFARRRPAA